jgi:hypothetical protein
VTLQKKKDDSKKRAAKKDANHKKKAEECPFAKETHISIYIYINASSGQENPRKRKKRAAGRRFTLPFNVSRR